MFEYIILCEKPSAAKNFAKALGGMSGTFDGKTYQIVAGRGHLLTLDEPHVMLKDESLEDRYKSWAINTMPWNANHFTWKKIPITYKDNRTGRTVTTKDLIQQIKATSSAGQKMVIATDVDPSGEGELLAWEIIDAIGWKKPVFRMYFTDEAAPSVQKAFRNMKDVSVRDKDGDYLKAEARNRWDYLSMQLTRIATSAARQAGYQTVARQGRLKSVIVRHIYEQEQAIKNYVRKPYYEVKFKDENGHTFARKLAPDADLDGIQFENKADAEQDKAKYTDSDITDVKTTRKTSAPGKLLDLSGLSAILATKGFNAKMVLDIYQKMYEAQIVSYPRTEDKFISTEQFNEMLPLVNNIADVVGVDKSLLTHRAPRKTHVKDGGAHGANRPGTTVPKSLEDIEKTYGACGKAIYTMLAKNFLAMFGEDYVYDAVTARLAKYPDFVTSFSVPVEMNYKLVFDTSSQSKDDSDDDDNENSGGIGKIASPFVFEGANKKPAKPTMKWIMSYLEKHDVGTGATRTSTLAEISSGKNGMLSEKKGVLSTTQIGGVSAVMSENTWIASVDITKQLFDAMADVGKFKRSVDDIIKLSDDVIRHDMPIMVENAKKLESVLGKPTGSLQGFTQKEKVRGTYTSPHGVQSEIEFTREWAGYRFTDDDVKRLLEGEEIDIMATTKSKQKRKVFGSLAEQDYKGKKFWGFKPNFDRVDPDTMVLFEVNGERIVFKREWCGHRFTDEEVDALKAGKTINIEYMTKQRKTARVDGNLQKQSYEGREFWGFKPDFKPMQQKDDSTHATVTVNGETVQFKREWAGHRFTDAEIKDLAAGKEISFEYKAKSGKMSTAKGTLQKQSYQGKEFWGFKADFGDFKKGKGKRK